MMVYQQYPNLIYLLLLWYKIKDCYPVQYYYTKIYLHSYHFGVHNEVLKTKYFLIEEETNIMPIYLHYTNKHILNMTLHMFVHSYKLYDHSHPQALCSGYGWCVFALEDIMRYLSGTL